MHYIIIFPTWNTFLSIYLSKLILLLMKNLNCNFLWPISVLNISKESLLTISQNLNFYAFHDSICTDGLLKEDINQYCNSFCMRFVGYKVRIEFFLKLLQILCFDLTMTNIIYTDLHFVVKVSIFYPDHMPRNIYQHSMFVYGA